MELFLAGNPHDLYVDTHPNAPDEANPAGVFLIGL